MATSEQATTPPGVSGIDSPTIEIDFLQAYYYIKKKLDKEFIFCNWNYVVIEATRMCIGPWNKKQSACWVFTKLLDAIWTLTFGRVNGPSPWDDLLKELYVGESNGGEDYLLDVDDWREIIYVSMEYMMREKLREESPMRIPTPEDHTPDSEAELSKHPSTY
ncbi:uncharacterized protein F4822DRAFT_432982 [Hypoxylon trugodes]|uniref:uncharacterized protein n=1 Tax=Hypoxylon trugodes TaxID=326681 RepID=UPI00218EA4A5|nr:uncharacterized protein F4822DRAFT_432982 [Hypoxylon trugodes]KAI1384436.1 hypothetical protein F4822DRAFT_432982 [Hypoxylon trugodes]